MGTTLDVPYVRPTNRRSSAALTVDSLEDQQETSTANDPPGRRWSPPDFRLAPERPAAAPIQDSTRTETESRVRKPDPGTGPFRTVCGAWPRATTDAASVSG